jgi:ATP-dependent Clp protease adaptor protein ClpS
MQMSRDGAGPYCEVPFLTDRTESLDFCHAAQRVSKYPTAERNGGARMPLRATKDQQKGGDQGSGVGTVVITRPKTQTRRPNMYRVLLLNDDYTPMEFVVAVLRKYFNKGPEEATRIMLHVHQHGVGECGVFTYEVAETKVTQVMDYARKHQHPLQCIMEKK